MRDGDVVSSGGLSSVSDKQKNDTGDTILKAQRSLLHYAVTSKFIKATQAEHVRPMFEVCWAPILAALSMIFEETEVYIFYLLK